ncbi:hypothetical protein O1611_g4813 [Lasiodiplodia mahajangana]|uniref:Uncharacterized protein n=1 Tax=Lasiodiplodia mahajangana TaxID=1108764 RepID=A0ACC2JN35_9PEZI|nr:hypothetical protein O1611_g4813 [Lasiodiplodia mahajangana]
MDPMSALSLACNIIDLVSKAIKGVVTIVEVSKSVDGLSNTNETLDREADGLKLIVEDLEDRQSRLSDATADQKMKETSETLVSKCKKLQTVLDGCRSSQRFGFFSATNACVKVFCKKGEIEQLQTDIVSSRDELFRWIATSTHAKINNVLKGLEAVTQTNCEIQTTLDDVDAQLRTLGDRGNLTGNGATAALEEIRQEVADRVILQLLYFGDLGSRLEGVVTPEQGTFEWIFTDPEAVLRSHPRLKMTFPQWLESKDGIFHICGKPGSGKSTLMKYIYRNPITKDLLAKWSHGDELLMAFFFFWRHGTQEQKSMRGLIRGLLYQILYTAPKLSREIFSRETRDRLVNDLQKHSSTGFNSPWLNFAGLDSNEIMTAFSRLVEVSKASTRNQNLQRIRICFFIDGLDEFDNTQINQSHRKLVEKLCQWTKDSNGSIKICVSSRIEEPFMDMLDESRRFTVQELTRGDIELFIENSFAQHSKFREYQLKSPQECRDLIHSIRQSAEGVFLWVALVVKDIEAGLDENVPIERLQEIVSEKPRDLDDLLKQIMSSISTASRRGVEVLLSAMLRVTGTLLSPERRIDRAIGSGYPKKINLSVLSAFLVLQATDKKVPMQGDLAMNEFNFGREAWLQGNMTNEEILEAIGKIVLTRCKGLIDLDYRKELRFMHRSVPECLLTYFTQASASISDHSSTVAMAWAALVDLKWLSIDKRTHFSLSSFLHGKRIPRLKPDGRNIVIECINRIGETKLDDWEDLFQIMASLEETLWLDKNPHRFYDFIQPGLYEFLDWIFRKTDILTDTASLCDVIMTTSILKQPAILETAFGYGVDGRLVFILGWGNEQVTGPLWYAVVLRIISHYQFNYADMHGMEIIIELWLRHGANPKVRFQLSADGSYIMGAAGVFDIWGYMSSLDYFYRKARLPPSLRHGGKKELSLRDIILHWKPRNESVLLDLLGDDTEDDVPDDLSEIDSPSPREAAASPQHLELEMAGKEDDSVMQPNQWLRAWVEQGNLIWLHIRECLDSP